MSSEELERSDEDIKAALVGMSRGFNLLVDLSLLESMEMDCLQVIGRVMELLDRSGVGLVVRVIPDPAKDLGFNILAIFHYPHHPRIVTCRNMMEASQPLGL